jgi:putative membrane protein
MYLNLIVKGFLIGIANIIPGMSGGTIALVLGIYERLIAALHNIGYSTVHKLLVVVTLKKSAISEAKAELRRIDFGFLMLLGIGAAIAILATSKLIIYLLNQQHDPTYGFFCGLILTSIIVPAKMLRRFKVKELIALLIAAALTVGLAVGMGEKNLEKAERKAVLHAVQTSATNDSETPPSTTTPPLTTDHSIVRLLYLFLCGALAISAMILPGVSGSFILLLLGVYFDILAAVNSRDVLVLAIFAIGCGLGLLAFTRLLNYVFEHHRDLTVSFLIGLMVGSLYGLWPFRTFDTISEERIDLAHILPQADMNLLITLLAFLFGSGLILLFYQFERKGAKA